ncbi:MAG: APC family permease [Bacteroidota bacterium]
MQVLQQPKQKKTKLKKVLGVAFGISIVIGGTIGAGILRVPGSIAALLPDARLIIGCWIILGLFIMLSASSYAELTTMLPKAGGAYNYIKRAFGNYAGFINGWFDFICNAIAPAYFCIVLSEYFILVFPQLQGYNTLLALVELTIFMLINFPGVKSGSIAQQISSAIKMLLFVALIIACFLKGSLHHSIFDGQQTKLIQGGLVFAIFKSMQLIMGTYDGWMAVSFFAEEDTDPTKNIPKSYLLGALTVSLLYILINVAILYVLPVASIAGSPLAASQASAIAFGKNGTMFMTIISIFSLLSILNAYIMIPPRILYGLSRDGYFIKQGTILNTGGTPVYSALFCYLLALVLIVFSSFDLLFSLGAFMMTVVTGFAFASLIKLRKTEPDLPRPYKAWGYPYSTFIAITVSIALLIGFSISDRKSLIIMLAVVLISLPCYKFLFRRTTTDTSIKKN